MSMPDELLDLARRLFAGATSQADLRRAVSTAYYSVFHLLVQDAMTRLIADSALRTECARLMKHDRMKIVCQQYSKGTTGKGHPVPATLQQIASEFVTLQEARHLADYDLSFPVTPKDVEL